MEENYISDFEYLDKDAEDLIRILFHWDRLIYFYNNNMHNTIKKYFQLLGYNATVYENNVYNVSNKYIDLEIYIDSDAIIIYDFIRNNSITIYSSLVLKNKEND